MKSAKWVGSQQVVSRPGVYFHKEMNMLHVTRRQLLLSAGAGAAAWALSPLSTWAADDAKGFTLPKLPYDYDALEPSIDALTMEIHHDRHHKAYVDNLNKATEGHPDLQNKSIDQLMRDIKQVPDNIRQAVINNGGGHANHSLFWVIMGPKGGGKPSGPLADDIAKTFGDFATFQTQLKQAGVSRFGSGWAWLVLADGKLQVISTPNQ